MKTKICILIGLFSFAFINANAQITDSIAIQNSCQGCDGSATVTYISGGYPPYTYSWSNYEAGTKDSFLCPRDSYSYTLTIYDSHGDTARRTFSIQTVLTPSVSVQNATCSNNNGTASISISGGITPYTYAWSNGATTSSVSGLSAGFYLVNVSANNGCDVTDSAIIAHAMAVSLSGANITCNGQNNGSASVSGISGGASPYTYSWSPSGNTNSSITGLSAGTYTVTVTDVNGCTSSASATITQPSLLRIDSIGTAGATCSNSNGSARVLAVGGTGPYTYSWTPSGGANYYATNLSAGTYTVTVTDNNGCTSSASATVPSTGLVANLSTVNEACYGENDGSATVTSVTGGASPYTYSWDPSGSTNSSISGLTAGSYTLTLTDHNGCTSTNVEVISQPAAITFIVDTLPDTGNCSGSAVIIVYGGNSPFTFSWSAHVHVVLDTLGRGEAVDSLCYGVYEMCVTDANGCHACDSIHIRHAPARLGIPSLEESDAAIKIYPIPVSSALMVQINGITAGNYNLTVYDLMGREILHSENILLNAGKSFPIDVSQFPPGNYMLRVYGVNLSKIAPFIVVR